MKTGLLVYIVGVIGTYGATAALGAFEWIDVVFIWGWPLAWPCFFVYSAYCAIRDRRE